MRKYVLTLNEQQAKRLAFVCEFYARIRCGQWGEIPFYMLDMSKDDFCERRDKAEEALLNARDAIYPELYHSWGHHYGVGKFKDADEAWELYEVLRNKIAWVEHPEGGSSVWFGEPRSFAGRELAKCEVKEE